MRILQFLLFSKRPLRVIEVVEILAVDLTVDLDINPSFEPGDRMPDPRQISRYYSSLVVAVPVRE